MIKNIVIHYLPMGEMSDHEVPPGATLHYFQETWLTCVKPGGRVIIPLGIEMSLSDFKKRLPELLAPLQELEGAGKLTLSIRTLGPNIYDTPIIVAGMLYAPGAEEPYLEDDPAELVWQDIKGKVIAA